MEAQKDEFAVRRDYLVPALKELGFDIPLMPAGAFYVYAGLPDKAPDAEKFCHRLLESYFVAVTPGTDFGVHNADRSIRISYARGLSQLKEAVYRIGKMLG
jgi:aspartate/methionine/tyrosine aminotransferase